MISEASAEKRAPEPLRIVQQFVNSADLEEGKEDLDTPAALGDWLRARDLLPSDKAISAADHRRALEVREGLRAVLLAHNGGTPDPAAVKRLEDAASHAALRPSFPTERHRG